MGRLVVALLAGLLLAGHAPAPAAAGGPKLVIGAAEDIVRQPSIVTAKAQFDLLALAGLGAVRITSRWEPGLTEPTAGEQSQLEVVTGAAALTGMRIYVAVYHADFRTTPVTEAERAEFASYAAAIVRRNPTIKHLLIGNEPNLNRFWMPQFAADGSSRSPADYLALLAQTYDAVKKVAPDVQVIGGTVSPRGNDRPDGIRPTHSPTTFIQGLGAAYRKSGRLLPVMDAFAIHPYQDNSSIPPGVQHPTTTTIAIADYGKLVKLLGAAFDGTAQPGSTLPVVYGEFGVETTIPAAKAGLYTGAEPASVKPVDAATQGAFYREALALAFCQSNVTTFLFFHAVDETSLDRWQSGMFYADGSPKASLPAVALAARDARAGVIARCAGMALTPKAKVAYPRRGALSRVPLTVRITCDLDCDYRVRLERLPRRSTTLAATGQAKAGLTTLVTLPARRVAPGRYRFAITLTAPVNPGPPRVLTSAPVTLR